MKLAILQALARQRQRYEDFLTARLRASEDGSAPLPYKKFDRYVQRYDRNFKALTDTVRRIVDFMRGMH